MSAVTAFLPNIGVPELLIVLGILILIFGPKQIPKAARSLGKGLRGFRESVEGKDEPEADLPEKSESSTKAQASGDSEPAAEPAAEKDETRA
jgi:sec-independent protein translocase protein TatA